MTGRASRRKGLEGEREVAHRFRACGWTVRGLEASGDWLCVRELEHGSPTLHIECKRAERLRLPEWLEQAAREAPPGAIPVVVWRQNRGDWYAVLPLDDLLGMLP